MESLQQLIQKEGQKGNYLKVALDEGTFPSEDIAREIGAEELFRLSRDSVEFRTKINLEILMSDYRIIGLMEAYVALSLESGRQDPLVVRMSEMIRDYRTETEQIKEKVVAQVMQGYDSSW